MSPAIHVTAVEEELARRRRRRRPLTALLLLVALAGMLAFALGIWALARFTRNAPAVHSDIVEHFKYGSIGSEIESGIPYAVWQALPQLFPEEFRGRSDYSAFGFLYESDRGRRRDLPIGISRRNYRGVDLVWFNCAVCHTGTYRTGASAPTEIVAGMPSNNLDLGRFVNFILGLAADERLESDRLMQAMQKTGENFNAIDRLIWRLLIIPRLREGLIIRQSRLAGLSRAQPDWGPGRVDTFNPYKLTQMAIPFASLADSEKFGTADFPSIFLQKPREGMQLHWDGNNKSLAERNLSAALGAGVTPRTVDHASIERVAQWLADLKPPRSVLSPDPAKAARGKAIYMRQCASCHGYQDGDRYVFEGSALGKVTEIAAIGTDPGRLNSYTSEFRNRQITELFAGTDYQFRHFTKTNGYANAPLDGLWLRGPYLHNGSVPTLAALLAAPADRPSAFVRGIDIVDRERGGMLSPGCTPGVPLQQGFCFDTTLPGNGNGGHLYGTGLPVADKADLLAYLVTF